MFKCNSNKTFKKCRSNGKEITMILTTTQYKELIELILDAKNKLYMYEYNEVVMNLDKIMNKINESIKVK